MTWAAAGRRFRVVGTASVGTLSMDRLALRYFRGGEVGALAPRVPTEAVAGDTGA